MKEKMISFLLENANPSIKRRVKSEILNNLTLQEAAKYQEQILQEPYIKRCFSVYRKMQMKYYSFVTFSKKPQKHPKKCIW